jgi:hypothetical protein
VRATQLTEIRNLKCQLLQRPERRALVAAAVLLLPGILTPARGQEAVRMSMASAEAAEARRRAASSIGYYNLKLGPTAWNFGTGLGLEYNSNVYNTEANPAGDFILRPQVNTRMLWPVSDQNSINLALGGGYSAYASHQRLDRAFITPDSELSFDLYVGEFWVNLHDRFSITEDTYQDPTVVGSGNYSQLQNALGVATTWDLNKAIVRAGYDHVIYDSLNGDNSQNFGGQPSGYSEVFSASAGYALRPGMLLGVEVGDSLINYTTTTTNTPYSNANQWNVGGFYDAPVSDYIHFAAHAGYSVYSPDAGGGTAFSGDFSGVYAQLDVTHRVNQYVSYTLSGGRTISVVFTGGTIDRDFARWQANWAIMRKVTLGTSFSFERGTQVIAGSETYDQYGPGVSLSRPITSKLSSSLSYQLYWRDSSLAGRNYTLNVVSLNFNYTF